MNNLTIVEASIKALEILNKPSSIEEIRKVIDDNKLYIFGAEEENIDSVIRNNIERCSENTNRTHTQKIKYFKRIQPNTFILLEWEKVNFYWVNIGKSRNEVKKNKYLWAPAYTYTNNGQTVTINSGWKHVPEVKKGDILFCQFDKKIQYIAIATKDAYSSPRPTSIEFDEWKKEGYKIEIDLIMLKEPVDRDYIINDLKNLHNDKCSPKLVTENNTISQQYLFSIPEGAAALILDAIENIDLNIYKNTTNTTTKNKPTETQKEAIIKARVGQGIFRKEVLELWNNTCPITKVNKPELLIASHILSWQLSNNEEKLDKYNGLPLTPSIDKLFDKGYVSFSDDGKLLLHNSLDPNIIQQLGININAKIEGLEDKHKYYLKKHRELYNII